MQNQKTGAEAAKWGRHAAAAFAQQIGATNLRHGANEFEWKGKRITIHSARLGSQTIGVTYNTLSRVQLVIGAFEESSGEFELWSVTPEKCKDELRNSLTGKDKVGLLTKGTFKKFGKFERKAIFSSTESAAPATKLKQNAFFEQKLGAKLKNHQWSWGAFDHVYNRVFLRIWRAEISKSTEGERVIVLGHDWNPKAPGYGERLEHIRAIEMGVQGIGVLSEHRISKDEKWHISGYDDQILIRLGKISREQGTIYAEIVGRFPISDLAKNLADLQSELVQTDELLEYRGKEGRKFLITHLRRERRPGLALAKRAEIRARNGCLVCEACDATEKGFPVSIGDACFEVHHRAPLSEIETETETTLPDLALLCANCHRMIHRCEPMPTVAAFKALLSAGTH